MAKISQIKLTDTSYDIDVATSLKATKVIGETTTSKVATVGAIQKPDGTNNLFDENNKISSHYVPELVDTNVKLSADLKTYYSIGKVTASGTSPYIIGYAGDSLRDVFNNLFDMDEVQPSITQPPSVSCSFSSSAGDERGTTISSISYSITFNDGAYTNSNTTGVEITDYSFSNGTITTSKTDSNGKLVTTGTLTLPSTYTVGTSSTFSTTLTATHSQGDVAKTNLGKDSDPIVRIASGSKTATPAPSFSKSAVDYPYFISNSAATVAELSGQSISKKTTNLTSSTGESCNYNANAYVWIFVRKGNTSAQPKKMIEAYSKEFSAWGTYLEDTLSMGEIAFNKANGVNDTFFAYRTKVTSLASGTVKFRLV